MALGLPVQLAMLDEEPFLGDNGVSRSHCCRRLQALKNSRQCPYSISMHKAAISPLHTCCASAGESTPGNQIQGCSQTAVHSLAATGSSDAGNAALQLRQLQHAWNARLQGGEDAHQLSRQLCLETAMQLAGQSLTATLEAMQTAAVLPPESAAGDEAMCRAEALMDQSIRRTKLAACMAAMIMRAEQKKYHAAAQQQQQQQAGEDDDEDEVSSCWHPCQ